MLDLLSLIEILQVMCPACKDVQVTAPVGRPFSAFFEGRSWGCSKCGGAQSLWDVFLPYFLNDHPMVSGAVTVGLVQSTVGTVDLTQKEHEWVDLGQYGIPEDADILEVFLTPTTPEGSVPSEFIIPPALGIQRLSTHKLPHGWRVTGMRGASDPSSALIPVPCSVNIFVNWQPGDVASERSHLVDAAKALSRHDHNAAILATNIAVEAKLFSVLAAHYSKFRSRKDVEKDFLVSGVSYGYQLRYLWPSLFDACSAPPFPRDLFGKLTRLKSLRNDAAHGRSSADRAEVCNLLLAALFAYEYLDEYGSLLA